MNTFLGKAHKNVSLDFRGERDSCWKWVILKKIQNWLLEFRNELEGSFQAHLKDSSLLCLNTTRSHFSFLQLRTWFVWECYNCGIFIYEEYERHIHKHFFDKITFLIQILVLPVYEFLYTKPVSKKVRLKFVKEDNALHSGQKSISSRT